MREQNACRRESTGCFANHDHRGSARSIMVVVVVDLKMRMRGICVGVAALVVVIGCAHPKSTVIIISSEEARGMNAAGERIEVTFPDNSDGTWILAHFLRYAEASGATRVSDIEIETTALH